MLDTLYRFIVPAMAGPHRLVPLAALADDALSPLALREAAERNRLKAHRDDKGQWLSTRHWADSIRRTVMYERGHRRFDALPAVPGTRGPRAAAHSGGQTPPSRRMSRNLTGSECAEGSMSGTPYDHVPHPWIEGRKG